MKITESLAQYVVSHPEEYIDCGSFAEMKFFECRRFLSGLEAGRKERISHGSGIKRPLITNNAMDDFVTDSATQGKLAE